MIASTKDIPTGTVEKQPEHAVEGAKYLQRLRDKDPKMVSEAERFFFLQ
jgi:membrane-bound lytic murein transglycosylase MltF